MSPIQTLCGNAFQSTHPSGVRLDVRQTSRVLPQFQSTHPSGVRRTCWFDFGLPADISIHAPQWGATWQCRYGLAPHSIFQSTHPSGVRRLLIVQNELVVEISIHAPQWGATVRRHRQGRSGSDFNPRTPVGCDSPATSNQPPSRRFQSTHPSGVRQAAIGHDVTVREFQSTHPSGVRR